MAGRDDMYQRLRAPAPTPADEMCTCPPGTPVKLMSTAGLAFNPIHCLNCNLEVEPERLGLTARLADVVASWLRTYEAIDALELQSGEYEQWARGELLNPESPANIEGMQVTRELNELNRCYFWFWQSDGDEGWKPRSTCPICGDELTPYGAGIFPQLLCERDSVVLVGR
jgi:hypothetical protein